MASKALAGLLWAVSRPNNAFNRLPTAYASLRSAPEGGFLWSDGDVCTTATMRIDHGGLRYHYPGKWAAYAVAEWTNQK
jgi:hypothetical protein